MSLETQHNIDRFLAGRMPSEEREAFEAALAQNPELARAVNLTDLVKRTVAHGHQEASRRQIVAQLRWRRRRIYWYIGGGILLVLLMALCIVWLRQPPTLPLPAVDTPDLRRADRYYRPPELEGLLASPDNATDRLFNKAKKLFETGHCTETRPLLRQLATDNHFSQQNTALLMLGCCYYEQKDQLDSALFVFKKIITSATTTPELRQHAEWYQALTQLQRDPNDGEARAFIQKVADDPQHPHHEDALRGGGDQ